MAKHSYKVLSQDGADFASRTLGSPVVIGDQVELDLSDHHDQGLSVLAAGWLEQDKKKGKE